ncbi:hypothetical protein WDW86_06755 [Bdellovibrionota bacterium FG-2]
MKNLIVGLGIGLSFVLAGCSGKSSTVEAPAADPATAQIEMKIGGGDGVGGNGAGGASDVAARKVTAFHAGGIPSMNEKIVNPQQSSIVLFDLAAVKSITLNSQLGDKTPIDLVAAESGGYPAVTYSFMYADFNSLLATKRPVGAAYLMASGAKRLMAINRVSSLSDIVTAGVFAAVTNDDGLVVFGFYDSAKIKVSNTLLVYNRDGIKVGSDIFFSPTVAALGVQGFAVVHLSGLLPRNSLNGWVIVKHGKPNSPVTFMAYRLDSPVAIGRAPSISLKPEQVVSGSLPLSQ